MGENVAVVGDVDRGDDDKGDVEVESEAAIERNEGGGSGAGESETGIGDFGGNPEVAISLLFSLSLSLSLLIGIEFFRGVFLAAIALIARCGDFICCLLIFLVLEEGRWRLRVVFVPMSFSLSH